MLAASLFGLTVVVWLCIAPPEVLWARVDPSGYATWKLRNTSSFTGPALDDIGTLESPLPDWRTVAQSAAADSIFHGLLLTPNRATRVYAVAGLALRDSAAAARAAVVIASDTASVPARLGSCDEYTRRSTRVLAALVSRPAYARSLLVGSPVCAARRRGPRP